MGMFINRGLAFRSECGKAVFALSEKTDLENTGRTES